MKAKRFFQKRWLDLDFQPYDKSFDAVDEIELHDTKGDPVALWQSDALLIRSAAPALFTAAQLALRQLREFYVDRDSQAILELKAAIASAKGGS